MIFHVAPMMGYTDYYFRNLMHFLYEDKVRTYSEMIVDKAIIFNTEKTLTKHFCTLNKSVIQIAGSNPNEISQCLKIINNIPYISEINFNLGCPSSRVQENKLGLALTQYPEEVHNCLKEFSKSKKIVSVKCRLGLGLDEDQDYIYNFLEMFKSNNITKVIIHCRNGVLNLNTKKNRTIPKINYQLFFKCLKNFPNIKLIPNGEIGNIDTINNFSNNNIKDVMIGRKFFDESLFLHNNRIIEIHDIDTKVLNYLSFMLQYPIVKKNLIQKSLLTLLTNVKDSKKYKKKILNAQTIDEIFSIFKRREIIWN
ncbi:tRNA-dihydrouridine synthase family protein [Alphaproteobacteria bacterium]|jgi:tRNA-dihydrouridine synthase A|nr:tRNA-dihydrouridine synthase family protein [Alphaproteobacteria bacterium]